MNIIKDVDPIFSADKYDVILVGTSTACSLASGFQGKIIRKYPYVDEANDKQTYRDNRRLGTRLTLKKDGNPIISLCYISKFNMAKKPTTNYESLENCLATANAEFKGKKVMTTVMGSTKLDGMGDKEKCLEIIEANTKDLDIDVYDYEQMTAQQERRLLYRKLYNEEKEKGIKWIKDEFKVRAEQKFKENYVQKIRYHYGDE